MNNLSALRQADECYKKVSVTVDRSQDERAVFKLKAQEAKTMSENSDKQYVVRGNYTPIIVEKRAQ